MKYIKIKGANQNNLKNLNIDIPRNKIIVFTGLSGSGKSSLVHHTIASEAKRQLYDTFTAFQKSRLPKFERSDCESIENLSPVILLEQKRITGNSRSTVGTLSEISPYLRLLFSRMGEPYVGTSTYFSRNSPEGMCSDCGGLGTKNEVDLPSTIDKKRSLNEGAIKFPDFKVNSLGWKIIVNSRLFDIDKPLENYSEKEMNLLLYAKEIKCKFGEDEKSFNMNFNGIITKIRNGYLKKDFDTLSKSRQKIITKFIKSEKCDSCKGTFLNKDALNCKIRGKNIVELSDLQLTNFYEFIKDLNDKRVETVANQILNRTNSLIGIGVGYLTLNRSTSSLSGGEAQRIKLSKYLGSKLTEMIYVLDEPSTGLHPRDVHLVNEIVVKLRDHGNTILIVEHDPDMIKIADHVIDMGPKAGSGGGNIVFQGAYNELLASDTLTGIYLKQKKTLRENYRKPNSWFELKNVSANNLKNFDIKIPKKCIVCITGVAGSGKSSLVHEEFLKKYPRSIVIDQSPIGKSNRSNPATYIGVFDQIRILFSNANFGSGASLFSFNSEGSCIKCKGLGYLFIDLAFMGPIKVTCEECEGKRFKSEVLQYKYKKLTIVDVLNLTVDQSIEVFKEDRIIIGKLKTLQDVGLGYLKLGQSSSTLSGGECQRVKLASELHKEGNVYILDEPTTGLHLSDVGKIIEIFKKLVEKGNSVIIIEHNLELVINCDWVIDIGLEGGCKGGDLVFEGTPSELVKFTKRCYTAEYLRQYISYST